MNEKFFKTGVPVVQRLLFGCKMMLLPSSSGNSVLPATIQRVMQETLWQARKLPLIFPMESSIIESPEK